jgi:uncharacterized protein (UPF0276 family)
MFVTPRKMLISRQRAKIFSHHLPFSRRHQALYPDLPHSGQAVVSMSGDNPN